MANASVGVVVMDMGPMTVPAALVNALLGRDTRYIHLHVRSAWCRRVLARLGVTPVNLGDVTWVSLPDESDEWAGRFALDLFDSWNLGTTIEGFSRAFPMARNAAETIRVGILRAMHAREPDLTVANLWLRSNGYQRAIVYGSSSWDRYILLNCDIPLKVRLAPHRIFVAWSRIVQSAIFVGSRIRRIGMSSNPYTPAPLSAQFTEGSVDQVPASVLFVANMGFTYGGLYSYDHFLSDDPASPLHPMNVIYISREGAPNWDGVQSYAISHMMGKDWVRIRETTRFLKRPVSRLLGSQGSRPPFSLLWFSAKFCARAQALSQTLRTEFPHAEVAILTYEIQIPSEFILALDSAGITSVAAHERPNTGITPQFPLAVHSLMTASPFFSQAISHSCVAAVVVAKPCGMWRTDLLSEARALAAGEGGNSCKRQRQKLLVALPFHVTETDFSGDFASETSVQGVRHFLKTMIDLAATTDEIFIEIRGKNDDWTRDSRFLDMTETINASANLAVNHDYDRPNVSYDLCARADLVIAKYTSLVDECLALSIPCIVHDFTHNSSGRHRRLIRYLPPEIFAKDDQELLQRISFARQGDGKDFREWWEPHRLDIYGELNDGNVRHRISSHIAALLGVSRPTP